MRDWLDSTNIVRKAIESISSSTEIHKARSKTLANRVKIVFDSVAAKDPNSININDTNTKSYLSMLSVTFEEISDYLALLQKKDKALGKRVMRFGCDEESFFKWNETLQTCFVDLGLGVEKEVFDTNQDLQDFNEDLEHLQSNLKSILQNVPGLLGTVESAVEANQKLLKQQEIERTQYKSQQAVKAEKTFDSRMIRYEKIIGTGGFGEVWKARYKGDNVAIKKVPSKALSDQAKISLHREAEFMKKLCHPRIVACFGVLEAEGNYCMVMELCVNGSLATFMLMNQSVTIDTEKRINFAIDIATGMNYLHKIGVIHRDLKPGNVVLDENYRAKITDFGLSVVKSTSQTSMKLDECGTPQYMAPESFGLAPIFSTKSDVYAFSIVLWELCHWKVAYSHVAVVEIKDSIKDGDRLPIDSEVPRELKSIITECWHSNPKNRPTFDTILQRLLNPAGAVGAPETFLSAMYSKKLKGINLTSKAAPANNVSIKKKNYRIMIAVIVVLVLTLIAGGIGIYTYLSSSKAANQLSQTITDSTLSSAATKTISRTPYPTATVSTVIQDSTLFQSLYGITVDDDDNIYVTIAVTSSNQPLPLAYRVNQGTPASLTLIANLSLDGQGYVGNEQGICYYNKALYVPRWGQLTKIDLANNNLVTRFAGRGFTGTPKDGANASAVFAGAVECVTDSYGNIYVVENTWTIRIVSQFGDVSTLTTTNYGKPFGLLFNGSSNLLYSTWTSALVVDLNLQSLQTRIIAGNSTNPSATTGPALLIQMLRLTGMTFDELGNLYIVQNFGHVISKYDSNGIISHFAGKYGVQGFINGRGNDTRFRYPRCITFDSKGRLLVTDQGNSALRMITW